MAQVARAIQFEQIDVAGMIARQFPEIAAQPVSLLRGTGTDNHIVRIGDDLCARFPKVSWAAMTAQREELALPRFEGAPLPVPFVYGLGAPDEDYPWPWSVLTWLPGKALEDAALSGASVSALEMAAFLRFVRSVPTDTRFAAGPENNGRGGPLALRSARFEAALGRLHQYEARSLRHIWARALEAAPVQAPVWLHGDMHPGNVLVEDGRISGVIDWGLCGVGDGACDLIAAWSMFDAPARDVFREAMDADEAEWLRGAGWALSMAVIYLPYAYENGLRSDMSERMIARLVEAFA